MSDQSRELKLFIMQAINHCMYDEGIISREAYLAVEEGIERQYECVQD